MRFLQVITKSSPLSAQSGANSSQACNDLKEMHTRKMKNSIPSPVLLVAWASLNLLHLPDSSADEPAAILYRRMAIPDTLLTTEDGHSFGGDLRIGDLDGDGRCDFLVYRSDDRGPGGPAVGGFKPCFLGAFDLDGRVIWESGGGGTHPVRPGSVLVHDVTGDAAAEVICFWHQPSRPPSADWQSLGDVVVQIRDGRHGSVIRQGAPPAITGRTCQANAEPGGRKLSLGRRTANWVHQRILAANIRGLDAPRDFVVKLGDTHVAFTDQLEVLWSYQTDWVEYSRCPAYIPAIGDIDGDGKDEVCSGYFLLDDDGRPLWEKRLGDNMDSVAITEWDGGKVRAICSGSGHVVDARGEVVLALGSEAVPHGQEVRVANFSDAFPGPEMVLRHLGHKPEIIVVSSSEGRIESGLAINASPTNVGMEAVFWDGPNRPALLYNGGWLWDLQSGRGKALPGLPPPNGDRIHRMGYYHAIPADLCGDEREELVVWDPTAAEVHIYTQPGHDRTPAPYRAGPRQYNPRIMD